MVGIVCSAYARARARVPLNYIARPIFAFMFKKMHARCGWDCLQRLRARARTRTSKLHRSPHFRVYVQENARTFYGARREAVVAVRARDLDRRIGDRRRLRFRIAGARPAARIRVSVAGPAINIPVRAAFAVCGVGTVDHEVEAVDRERAEVGIAVPPRIPHRAWRRIA